MSPRRTPLPLFILMAAVVLGTFAFVIARTWLNHDALASRGRTAPAAIVEIGAGRGHRITVEYRTGDGRAVRTLIDQGDEVRDPTPHVGDHLSVVYDPSDPTAEVRDTRVPPNHQVELFIVTVVGLIFAVGLATWWRRAGVPA
jgi:hypothetical protein